MHVSGMSFLNERFLRFVLIVWSLYIRVSITSIVFLMERLMNNDLSKGMSNIWLKVSFEKK